MDNNEALALVFSRNTFYKRMHYLTLAAFGLALIVIIFLGSVLTFLLRNPTQPIYFETDNVSRLIKVIPVNTPNMTKEDVIAWTTEAVEAAYSYNFINFRAQLQSAQKYFTNYGWRTYMKELVRSNNLVGIRERKFIGIAKVIDTKELTEGILSGAYAWKFQMLVYATYLQPPNYDDVTKISNPLVVTSIVQRQPVLQGYKGLGILQMIGDWATRESVQSQTSNTSTQ
jgi:intracellular multiplication protein IcmL